MNRKMNGARRVAPRAGAMLLGFLCMESAFTADPVTDASLEPRILSSPALGPVPGNFASWSDLFAEQQRLNAAADRIVRDPAAAEGLAGIVADPEARHLQVFWKGDAPQSTRTLLAELRREVPVVVQPARHSHAELLAAHRRVIGLPHVLEATPAIDGSGLKVVFDARHTDTAARGSLARRIDYLVAGVPVNYSAGTPAVAVGSRDEAVPPYGGSRIYLSGTDSFCTLGPPAMWDDDKTGSTIHGWLTAAHCVGDLGTRVYNTKAKKDARKSVIGYVHHVDGSRDTAFIEASGTVTGRVFVGRPFAETASVPVGGSAPNYVGNIVFVSGSATGLNGGLRILELLPQYETPSRRCAEGHEVPESFIPGPGSPCYWIYEKSYVNDVVRAEHLRKLAAAGNSDSGGVAMSFLPDGRALIRGVVLKKDDDYRAACPSVSRVDTSGINAAVNSCTYHVLYADWSVSVNSGMVSGPITGTWH